jgi:hypothetical protein
MRATLLPILAIGLVGLWTGVCGAQADAFATLAVSTDIGVTVQWQTSGTTSQNFGTTTPGSSPTDNLILTVTHNLGPAQTFNLSSIVTKPGGPDWDLSVTLNDGSETLTWLQADFGTSRQFTAPIGGVSENFNKNVAAQFNVGAQQNTTSYQFQINLTVTAI